MRNFILLSLWSSVFFGAGICVGLGIVRLRQIDTLSQGQNTEANSEDAGALDSAVGRYSGGLAQIQNGLMENHDILHSKPKLAELAGYEYGRVIIEKLLHSGDASLLAAAFRGFHAQNSSEAELYLLENIELFDKLLFSDLPEMVRDGIFVPRMNEVNNDSNVEVASWLHRSILAADSAEIEAVIEGDDTFRRELLNYVSRDALISKEVVEIFGSTIAALSDVDQSIEASVFGFALKSCDTLDTSHCRSILAEYPVLSPVVSSELNSAFTEAAATDGSVELVNQCFSSITDVSIQDRTTKRMILGYSDMITPESATKMLITYAKNNPYSSQVEALVKFYGEGVSSDAAKRTLFIEINQSPSFTTKFKQDLMKEWAAF